MIISLEERQLNVINAARFGERLVMFGRPHSIFLDPDFGEFQANYYHFLRGKASHPARRKRRDGPNKVSLEEARQRIKDKKLPVRILKYGGATTNSTLFEDIDFGTFEGKLCDVLRGKRSHPERYRINLSAANKKSWTDPSYISKVREGIKKVDYKSKDCKRKSTCVIKYGTDHWSHRNLAVTSFGAMCPGLLKEFHPTKNQGIDPFKINASSHRKVWWKCYEGRWPDGSIADDHEWTASLKDRFSKGAGCPCCAGKKTVTSNCLATVCPAVLRFWDHESGASPYSYSPYSHVRVGWRCDRYPAHRWSAIISSVANGSSCPLCHESRGERLIRRILENMGIVFARQYSFDDCKLKLCLKFDFAVFRNSETLLIEFNGEQHYRPIAFNKSVDPEREFEYQVIRDQIKADYCSRKSLPLLVIPYYDINRCETMIKEFLQRG